MAVLRCPVCEKRFDSEQSGAMPFCSLRCKQVDLGRWLDEGYGMPYEAEDESPEGYDRDRPDSQDD